MKRVLFVVSCLAVACSTGNVPAPCASDRECPATEECRSGSCVPKNGSGGCTADLDCLDALAAAAPSPMGCAEARCVMGQCTLRAKDLDGDGHRGKSCAAAVPVETGDDCDDTAAAVSPSAAERCDEGLVDDDCDGTVNEGCACTSPGTSQACCSGRGTQTCESDGGYTALSACTAPVSAEVCNGVDDDCDGTADDAVSFASDAGFTAIDGGLVRSDGTCEVGVGACRSSGMARCAAGALGCDAVAGTPGTESCNGLDDDCDGAVDENPSALCPAVTGQSCVAGACACSAGQVACGSSCVTLGGSCSVGTGACARSGSWVCTAGARTCSATAGNPVAETCDGVDNDCDGQVDEGTFITCFPDGDNDRYASNSNGAQVCPNPSRPTFGNCPVGMVSPSASLGTDCSPNDPNAYRMELTSADSDGDGRCSGSAASTCVGASAPPGRRFTSTCNGSSDCNDGNGSVWESMTVSNDADNDRWCAGGAFTACTNGNAPAGTRPSSTCMGVDCRDTNPNAGASCLLANQYSTVPRLKMCNIGPPPVETFSVPTQQACPAGFSPTNLRTVYTAGATCTAPNANTVTIGCGTHVIANINCSIIGDCAAN